MLYSSTRLDDPFAIIDSHARSVRFCDPLPEDIAANWRFLNFRQLLLAGYDRERNRYCFATYDPESGIFDNRHFVCETDISVNSSVTVHRGNIYCLSSVTAKSNGTVHKTKKRSHGFSPCDLLLFLVNYTMPWACIALATFRKPAMLAPAT